MRRLVLASCDTITLKTHFINAVKAAINEGEPAKDNVTIGMDLGDKNNAVYVLDKNGREELRGTIDNNVDAIRVFFSKYPGATVAIEAVHIPLGSAGS